MIPIAGSVGIGTVWGWLVGERLPLKKKPFRSFLSIILITFAFAGIVYFYERLIGILLYLISMSVCISLQHIWRGYLERIRVTSGRKELEEYS
jgi:hypothetical protein